jgi:hypothetical protein
MILALKRYLDPTDPQSETLTVVRFVDDDDLADANSSCAGEIHYECVDVETALAELAAGATTRSEAFERNAFGDWIYAPDDHESEIAELRAEFDSDLDD